MRASILIACFSALVAAAASQVPVPRIARTLPAAKAAECSARAAHNAQLKTFFERSGLPMGDSPSNVVARTKELIRLNARLTNSAALPPPGKHSKDYLSGFSAGVEAAKKNLDDIINKHSK